MILSSKIHPNTLWYRAISAFIGSVVGVGVFGLPFTFSQSGFVIGAIELLVIGVLFLMLLLMFAEVVYQTEGRHRFVGYVRLYLGRKWGDLALFTFVAAMWGAMIAYIIVGGTFLFTVLGPILHGPSVFYHVLVALIAWGLTARGFSFLSKAEVYVIGTLFFLFLFLILASLPHINLQHFSQFSFSQALAPYGVLLFAFGGLGVIPEMKEILGPRQVHRLPQAVVVGHVLVLILYGLFAFAVVGVTGRATTEIAFEGLIPVLGPVAAFAGSLLGAVAILSIFSLLALQLQQTLEVDYQLPRRFVWFITIFVPLFLFLVGLREFIHLVGFIGAVFGGINALLIMVTYRAMRKQPICKEHHCLNLPKWLGVVLAGVFILGIVLKFIAVVK